MQAHETLSDARANRVLACLTLAALLLRLPAYGLWWFNPDEAIYWQVSTFEAERVLALEVVKGHEEAAAKREVLVDRIDVARVVA